MSQEYINPYQSFDDPDYEALRRQIYKALVAADGNPSLDRGTRRPYDMTARNGAWLIGKGGFNREELFEIDDSTEPPTRRVIIPEAILEHCLSELERGKNLQAYIRVIVQSGELEEGISF